MKPSHIGATLALAAACTALPGPALAVEVGVSVQISQPGIYGRIDIGRLPLPQVVLPTPVIITPPPLPRVVVGVPPQPQPIYMWVPPGHQKNWAKHCRRYNACGVPVYFVQDGWYHDNVYPQGKGRSHDNGNGNGKGHGRGHGKHD